MRLLGNILILVFVVGTLYAVRSDILPLTTAIGTNIENFTEKVVGIPDKNTGEISNNTEKVSDSDTKQESSTEPTPDTLTVTTVVKKTSTQTTKNSKPGPLLLPTTETPPSTKEITIESVIAATNKERSKAGLPSLSEQLLLDESAQAKVDDMFARQYFEHTSPIGTTLEDLVQKTGYQYITIGENLAYGNFNSAEEVLAAWMKSPGHRANILNVNYSEIGIGLRLGTYQGREVWMFTQHFGLPATACPTIDQKLKLEVDTKTALLNTLSAEITGKKDKIEQTNSYTYEYEQLVKEYNQMVQDYNALVAEVKIKIEDYNAMVNDYNSCVASHTTMTESSG